MMTLCILGRLPALAIAELEQQFGSDSVRPIKGGFAEVDAEISLPRLGGTVKTAKYLTTLPTTNPQKAFDYCRKELAGHLKYLNDGKLKLGVSLYGLDIPVSKINANMLSLKKVVKASGRSVRVVPNTEPALSSAQTYHNKLTGELGMELVFIRDGASTLLGQVIQVQDIDAYAARDQARPKTDAFVGMLPPKLAQMMINMTGIVEPLAISFDKTSAARASAGAYPTEARSEAVLKNDDSKKAITASKRLLDPFCGTGVVLQEAALMGYDVYGTDLSDKMVDYSKQNLAWAKEKYRLKCDITIEQGDAMTAKWQSPIDAIVAETYLGQPFSAPPSAEKLAEVRRNCNHIISSFLTNLLPQIPSGTPLCLAIPAWRSTNGQLTHLPLTQDISHLGYERLELTHVPSSDLLYSREDQVVARQLLLLTKK